MEAAFFYTDGRDPPEPDFSATGSDEEGRRRPRPTVGHQK
jgi:hypothetical protein